jgi:prolyl 4-hydroxylase
MPSLLKHADHIWTIERFLSPPACRALIEFSEKQGYLPATVDTEKGPKLVAHHRNNERVIKKDTPLAHRLYGKAVRYVPAKVGICLPVGLNELFRYYKYGAGHYFKKHRDQPFIRNGSEASYITFMIYLNDDYKGGETKFNTITIQPKKGTALMFYHELEHEGAELLEGTKYVLRTDVMYRMYEM